MSKCTCFKRKPTFSHTDSFSDKLTQCTCKCNKTSVSEKGKSFGIYDKNGYSVEIVKVDDFLLSSDTKKCDFLFFCKKEHTNTLCFFVELKGSDVKHAFHQIDRTLAIFKDENIIRDKIIHGVIAFSSNPVNTGTIRDMIGDLKKKYAKHCMIDIYPKRSPVKYSLKAGKYF